MKEDFEGVTWIIFRHTWERLKQHSKQAADAYRRAWNNHIMRVNTRPYEEEEQPYHEEAEFYEEVAGPSNKQVVIPE